MSEKPKLLVVEDDAGLQRQLKWSYEDQEVILAGVIARPRWTRCARTSRRW